jgi:putative selenate reductase
MVDLYCTPLTDLIDRMRLEFRNQQAIFDLPARKWYLPPRDPGAPDVGVSFHGMRAASAVGPASGPQTQMAQNLVLSWLAGARILELKTVQIDDRLEIGRPCIDATNVGYNIEFSQELLVPESLDQYVQGAMLIHMLAHAPEVFGSPFGDTSMQSAATETIYDMSIGYDLAGIKSDKVRPFIEGMIDAKESVERNRALIPKRLAPLRDLDYPTQLSKSVTLSTFHGCPANEIEKICEFLLAEVGVHTIVKMNPPMLGKPRLEHLLYDVMGYHDVTVNESAYTSGLQFDESIAMTARLADLAKSKGLSFGAKFSNTLEVTNHRDFFSPDEKVMYLSGTPLHVITLTLAQVYREAVGHEIPISFSAGVDRKNFANLVACGFTPITTCTDLLKTGGYGRLPPYLKELEKAMESLGAATIDDFILDRHGNREAAGGCPQKAGFLNGATIVQHTQQDERYYQPKNSSVPRRIGSHLKLFDCITCYKCVPVCPNDANFYFDVGEVDISYRDIEVYPDGATQQDGEPKSLTLKHQQQIANFADYCNHCGNCDTFCPEYDGPYLIKPTFFGSQAAFAAAQSHDGFFLERISTDEFRLNARMESTNYLLEYAAARSLWTFDDGCVRLSGAGNGDWQPVDDQQPPETKHFVDIGRVHSLVVLLRGITNARRIHAINAPLLSTESNEPG